MTRFVFGMNKSLDGNVDHMSSGPSPALFRHLLQLTEEALGRFAPSDAVCENILLDAFSR